MDSIKSNGCVETHRANIVGFQREDAETELFVFNVSYILFFIFKCLFVAAKSLAVVYSKF